MNRDITVKFIPLLFCLNLFAFAEENSIEITHCWGGVWLPFWEMGADSIPTGFDIDILNATCKEADIVLNHTPYVVPWKRTIYSIETGMFDITTAASKTQEREQFAYFIGPYRYESIALYVRKGESADYPIHSFRDLLTFPDISIGSEAGSIYNDEIDSILNLLGDRVQDINDMNFSNRGKLKAGRIDMYLGYPIDENLYTDSLIEQHPMPITQLEGVYFMVSKSSCSQATADSLENAFRRISMNGVYDSIKAHYSEKYEIHEW